MTFVLVPLVFFGLFVLLGKVRISYPRARQLVFLYLILLLASIPLFYSLAESTPPLPPPGPGDEEDPDQDLWDEYHQFIDAFYQAAFEGRLEDFAEAELVKEWSFEYDGERLLLTKDNEHYQSPVVLKRKEAADGKVEVKAYAAVLPFRHYPSIPPDLNLTGEVLEIASPKRQEILTIHFMQDFTSAQFTGAGLWNQRVRGNFFFGEHQVLYILIPRDLQIDMDGSRQHNVHWIHE